MACTAGAALRRAARAPPACAAARRASSSISYPRTPHSKAKLEAKRAFAPLAGAARVLLLPPLRPRGSRVSPAPCVEHTPTHPAPRAQASCRCASGGRSTRPS